MSWSQTGATHYHAELGLPDKGCAIKGWLSAILCGLDQRRGWVLGLAQGTWDWFIVVVVRMAIELMYHNTPFYYLLRSLKKKT